MRTNEEEEHESEQKTAVAATRSNRNILKAQVPLGMELLNENFAVSMRKDLPERTAMYSDPPTRPVAWPVQDALPENVNVMNHVLAHTELGAHAEVAPFARWCNETPQHIIIITFTSQDRSRGTEMWRLRQQAQTFSLCNMC